MNAGPTVRRRYTKLGRSKTDECHHTQQTHTQQENNPPRDIGRIYFATCSPPLSLFLSLFSPRGFEKARAESLLAACLSKPNKTRGVSQNVTLAHVCTDRFRHVLSQATIDAPVCSTSRPLPLPLSHQAVNPRPTPSDHLIVLVTAGSLNIRAKKRSCHACGRRRKPR